MITPELIEYIQAHLKKNISKEKITADLVAVGWYMGDIEEGFEKVSPKPAPAPVVVTKPVTPPIAVAPAPVIPAPEVKKFTYTIPTSVQRVEPVKIPTTPPANFTPPILSSYAKAASSTQMVKGSAPTQNKNHRMRWVILVIFIVTLISGVAYASFSGYIKIPFLNSVALIKKDPKTILLAAPSTLGALTSYKTETSITLSFPLLSDISTELSSGQPIDSTMKDWISIHALGAMDRNTSVIPRYNYTGTVSSSLLKDNLPATWTYDGNTSYVSVPKLNELLGSNAPSAQVVSVPNGQLGLIVPVLRQNIKDILTTYDTNNILSNGLSPMLAIRTGQALETFINSADITSTTDDMVNGMSMYHYQVNANTDTVDTFINTLSNIFLANVPVAQKANASDTLGAVRIKTFEFWVGKNDNTIYQYKVALSIPLSKVIGIEDKSVAGNMVTLTWQTRLYDLNIPNTITIPQAGTPIEDFARIITDMKIKNASAAFNISAQNFRSVVGNYSNTKTSGSCTKPVVGSLFSPLGHSKAASVVVGDIATDMNTVINFEGDTGLCYSSSSAWAMSLPLASDPNTFYCTDSTGVTTNLTTPITGAVCK